MNEFYNEKNEISFEVSHALKRITNSVAINVYKINNENNDLENYHNNRSKSRIYPMSDIRTAV